MKNKVVWSVALTLAAASVVLLTGVDRLVATETAAVAPAASSGFTFEGCWTQFPAAPCYDIFRDSAGNYWKCKKCGATKNANQGSCNPISLQTLNSGSWCS